MREARFASALVALIFAAASCSGANEPTDQTTPTTTEPSSTETLAELEPVQAASQEADGLAGIVAIVDVRVFDGTTVLPKATVVIEDGLISAIGPDAEVSPDAWVVDGKGKTLLPGLIDSHTHSVQDRVDEGAHFIKLVLEDGSPFGQQIPTLDEVTLRAAIDQASSRDLLSVTHVSTLDSATTAINNGSDGLAHLFVDAKADDNFVDLIVDREAFVVPTIVVISSATNSPSGQSVLDDLELGSRLTSQERTNLATGFGGGQMRLDVVLESVARLHAAGVPLLAGTDAPNPGTTYGASLHRELEYFTEAGMSSVEALASATSAPAEVFGLTDRGHIAPGFLADLVLVDGDPTTDITASRSIVAVWKNGIPISID